MSVEPWLLDGVRERVRAAGVLGRADLAPVVDTVAREHGTVLGSHALDDLARAVHDEIFGAGVLQPLLDDPDVTDVLVNGPDDVWVERAGRLRRADVRLGTPADVRALAVRLASVGGQRLDDAVPVVDARLPDGTRLHAVLPPVADACTAISLRVVRGQVLGLDELVARGTVARALAPLVRALVAARANVLVTGATGAGKTTLLAALLGLVPADQRIVVIEESGELAPRHPHVVHLLARRPNVDGAGAIDLAALVRQALRMRPDRIVLGECRGAEVRDVLTALNTGHEGCCATLHANTAADVPARLGALAALAGMSRDAVAAQAAAALDAVLHLRRDGSDRSTRYLAEVGVVRRGGGGALEVVAAVRADPQGVVTRGPGWPALVARLGRDLPMPAAASPVGPDVLPRGSGAATHATVERATPEAVVVRGAPGRSVLDAHRGRATQAMVERETREAVVVRRAPGSSVPDANRGRAGAGSAVPWER